MKQDEAALISTNGRYWDRTSDNLLTREGLRRHMHWYDISLANDSIFRAVFRADLAK